MADEPELRHGDGYAVFALLIGPYDDSDKAWRRPVFDRISELIVELSRDPSMPTVMAATKTIKLPVSAFDEGQTPNMHQLFSHLGHYTSTHCLHGEHEDCRLTCKHDVSELCNCWCHEI